MFRIKYFFLADAVIYVIRKQPIYIGDGWAFLIDRCALSPYSRCRAPPLAGAWRGELASLRLFATVAGGGAWSHVVRDVKSLGSCIWGEGRTGDGSLGRPTLSNLADCDYFCTINRYQKREEKRKKAQGDKLGFTSSWRVAGAVH